MSIYTDALREGWLRPGFGHHRRLGDRRHLAQVSGTATAIALVVGLPVGMLVGARRFIGRTAALIIFNSGMGLPPVFVGLIVAMTLSRRGPLGDLSLLYSKTAMVIAQVIIATPVIMAVTAAAVAAVPRELRLQAKSLGAQRWRVGVLTLSEARMGIIAAVAAGFGADHLGGGRLQMVGGNLAGDTRVMTTAIMQYTRMGRYGPALALAMVLLQHRHLRERRPHGLQTSAEKWERQ